MPIFAAVMMVVRRGRTEVRTVPYAGAPLWRLLAEEIADSLRRLQCLLSRARREAAGATRDRGLG